MILFYYLFVSILISAQKLQGYRDLLERTSTASNIEKRCSPCIPVGRDQERERERNQNQNDPNDFNEYNNNDWHNNSRRLNLFMYEPRLRPRYKDKDLHDDVYWNPRRPSSSRNPASGHFSSKNINEPDPNEYSNDKHSSNGFRSNLDEFNNSELSYDFLHEHKKKYQNEQQSIFNHQRVPIYNVYRGNGYDNLNEHDNNNHDKKYNFDSKYYPRNNIPVQPQFQPNPNFYDDRRNRGRQLQQRPLVHHVNSNKEIDDETNVKYNAKVVDCINQYSTNNGGYENYNHRSRSRTHGPQLTHQSQHISTPHYSSENDDFKGTSYLHDRNNTLISDVALNLNDTSSDYSSYTN